MSNRAPWGEGGARQTFLPAAVSDCRRGLAHDLLCDFHGLVNTFRERESVLVSETVEFLAPQRILEDTLESRDLDRPAISDHRIYKIVISYRDADGSQFRETFTVDRYMEMERTILDADLRNKAIDQLSKRISKLTERLQGSP